jgi:hypothetical protein
MCWQGQKIATIVQLCLAAKHAKKEEEEGSGEEEGFRAITNNWLEAIEQLLPIYNFFSSMIILSIHMWLQKIVLKNLPIYDIECEVEREMVCFP